MLLVLTVPTPTEALTPLHQPSTIAMHGGILQGLGREGIFSLSHNTTEWQQSTSTILTEIPGMADSGSSAAFLHGERMVDLHGRSLPSNSPLSPSILGHREVWQAQPQCIEGAESLCKLLASCPFHTVASH